MTQLVITVGPRDPQVPAGVVPRPRHRTDDRSGTHHRDDIEEQT